MLLFNCGMVFVSWGLFLVRKIKHLYNLNKLIKLYANKEETEQLLKVTNNNIARSGMHARLIGRMPRRQDPAKRV